MSSHVRFASPHATGWYNIVQQRMRQSPEIVILSAAKDLTRPNAEILRFAQSLCVRVWRGRLARVFCSESRARHPRHE